MKKQAAGVTLLWGEDDFLLREEALAVLGGLAHTEMDAGEWVPGILGDLATPSLFGEPRALLISDAKSLDKAALAELAAYVQEPDPDATLVISCVVADRGKVPAALEKVVKPVGEIREVAVSKKDLQGWLVRRGKDAQIDLSPPAANQMVQILGDSIGRLSEALSQLGQAFSGRRITPEMVSSQFTGLGDQNSFELCDKMFAGDLSGAVRSYRTIEVGGQTNNIMVLGSIAARLRDLIKVRSLGVDLRPAEIAEAMKKQPWQVTRLLGQARNYSMAQLIQLHERVVETDAALKSSSAGSSDVVMLSLIAAIAAR